MARFLSIVLLLHVSLIVVALIDCLSARPAAIRNLSPGAWIFLILLASPLGALAWFVAGQPTRTTPARRRRPAGPDDDPAFIASLAATLNQKGSNGTLG